MCKDSVVRAGKIEFLTCVKDHNYYTHQKIDIAKVEGAVRHYDYEFNKSVSRLKNEETRYWWPNSGTRQYHQVEYQR